MMKSKMITALTLVSAAAVTVANLAVTASWPFSLYQPKAPEKLLK